MNLRDLLVAFWLLTMLGPAAQAADRLFPFEENNRWGYRDEQGTVVIEPEFVIAYEFSPEGIAAVATNKEWLYIDTRGDIIIKPFIFDNAPDPFSEGLARFTEAGKFGFFDRRGDVIIEPRFELARPFVEGRAAICIGCKIERQGEHDVVVGGNWGYIDHAGRIVISVIYDDAGGFESGKAKVRRGGAWLYIDRGGKIVAWSDPMAAD